MVCYLHFKLKWGGGILVPKCVLTLVLKQPRFCLNLCLDQTLSSSLVSTNPVLCMGNNKFALACDFIFTVSFYTFHLAFISSASLDLFFLPWDLYQLAKSMLDILVKNHRHYILQMQQPPSQADKYISFLDFCCNHRSQNCLVQSVQDSSGWEFDYLLLTLVKVSRDQSKRNHTLDLSIKQGLSNPQGGVPGRWVGSFTQARVKNRLYVSIVGKEL